MILRKIKELKTAVRKLPKYIFLLCLIVALGGVIGICTLVFNPQNTHAPAETMRPDEELTVTVISSAENAQPITLFTTKPQPSGASISLKKGETYTLVIESSYAVPSVCTLYYAPESIAFTQNSEIILSEHTLQISLEGEKSIRTDFVCLADSPFFEGLTMENSEKYTAYAACGDFLVQEIAETEKPQYDIVLLNDIEVEKDLLLSMPCSLLLNEYQLSINGDLVFDTRLQGSFAVRNAAAEQIFAEHFFVEAPDCDITVGKDFFDFQDAMDFYINAKSYNGKALEPNTRTILNAEMLRCLLDESRYPRLQKDTKIILDSPLELEDWDLQVSLPVTFQVNAALSASPPIIINTRETGSIYINVAQEGSADGAFSIQAPNCGLFWSGNDVPAATEVAEQMNVKAYNGEEMSPYGLGGNGQGEILSFALYREKNKKAQEDILWNISGNVISAGISYLVSEASLQSAVLSIEVEDGTASFNKECINTDGSINLLKDCTCTVTDAEGGKRVYAVRTQRVQYNLPVVNITIDGGGEVTSRDVYKTAKISINGAGTPPFSSLEETSVKIRGRGNSTWKWEKKPYKLKFYENTSVLGMTAAKEWVLLANYSDKTLIRNYIALEMGKKLDYLEFSPTQYPVDLFVNGTYRGVYTLGEQIEVKKGRVEIDKDYDEVDTGYLLEVGGAASAVNILGKEYFNVGTLWRVYVESPDVEKLSPEAFAYIKDYVSKADAAVTSLTNYEDYIDVDSLIDWFILHELTYNLDSGFRRSCYMTKEKGGKLKMGPIWDFDLALGNFYRDNPQYDDWATAGEPGGYVWVTWMNYLLEDAAFRQKLRARWDAVKEDLLDTALTKIEEMAKIIEPSQEMNFAVWQVWDKRAGYAPYSLTKYDTYEKQIQYLEDFLNKRYKWMDAHI